MVVLLAVPLSVAIYRQQNPNPVPSWVMLVPFVWLGVVVGIAFWALSA